jgi:hypothetical protein
LIYRQQAYSAAAQQSVFAMRDRDGGLVAASSPEIGAIVARWPPADSEPNYFRLCNFGPSTRDYSGVTIAPGPRIDFEILEDTPGRSTLAPGAVAR